MATRKLKVQPMVLNSFFKSSLILGLALPLVFCFPRVFAAEKAAFKISSDSHIQDFANQIIIYKGNAIFTMASTSVNGDEIKAYKTAQEIKKVRVTGTSAELSQYQENLKQLTQLSADTINYQLDNKTITAHSNITIIQTTTDNPEIAALENKSENYFKAQVQNLSLLPTPQNLLTMSGKPLQITINQPNQAPMIIEANKMTYDQKEQLFELLGDVILSTGRETIKTAKVLYNGKTKVLQLPETPGERVEMTQAKKGYHE